MPLVPHRIRARPTRARRLSLVDAQRVLTGIAAPAERRFPLISTGKAEWRRAAIHPEFRTPC